MKDFVLNEDQQRLVEENLNLVEIILRVHIRPNECIRGMEYDDLYQCGCMALCKAAAFYDGRVQFNTYASHVIKNAMIDQCRRAVRDNAANLSYDEDVGFLETFPSRYEIESDVTSKELTELLKKAKRTHHGAVLNGIEAIELKLKGYTGAEIANMYGVKNNNVTNWISKANSTLRKEYPEFCIG